ncbi:predicted protein [Nematostella vectensis]|uniref:Uncharacterized protein n=1 Tax=Nematostella vectensis TaxID=45351 RepID=A7RYN8_NEMVE|nr:RNA-binding protein 25 [Nematostella vectensis]EDO43397.1 predicted protein [Nematostella vectensis]|eukprot:XP_001635460.1 predicted protein [Nematostella vectensis]
MDESNGGDHETGEPNEEMAADYLIDEKTELVRGFLQEKDIIERAHTEELDELRLSFETEKEAMIRSFDCEREEMRRHFDKEKDKIRYEFQQEKHVLKLAFEDEKLNIVSFLEKEIEELRGKFEKEKKELRDHFNKAAREREHQFRLEKAEAEGKVRRELERVQEVEGEIKRTLLKGLGDLENIYFSESAALEHWQNNDKPEADMHFKGKLDDSLNEDRKLTFKDLEDERNKMFLYHSTRQGELEHEFSGEIVELEQRFKEQKKDLMNIFKNEKQELEENARREKEDIRQKLETDFRRVLKHERSRFDATLQGFENDIAMLRYQKEQLEKSYSLEVERLQFRFERERLENEKRVGREKRELKRLLREHFSRKMYDERMRLDWVLRHLGLGGSGQFAQVSRSSSCEFFPSSNSSVTSGSSEL